MFGRMRVLLYLLAVEGILTAAVNAQLLGECMTLSRFARRDVFNKYIIA